MKDNRLNLEPIYYEIDTKILPIRLTKGNNLFLKKYPNYLKMLVLLVGLSFQKLRKLLDAYQVGDICDAWYPNESTCIVDPESACCQRDDNFGHTESFELETPRVG